MLERNCSLLLSRGPTTIDGFWNLWYNRKKLLSQRCVKKKTTLGTSWFHLSLLAVTAHSLKHILHLRESKCPIEREPLCMFEPNDGCLLFRSRTPISIVYWRKPLWMKVGEGLKIYVFHPWPSCFTHLVSRRSAQVNIGELIVDPALFRIARPPFSFRIELWSNIISKALCNSGWITQNM